MTAEDEDENETLEVTSQIREKQVIEIFSPEVLEKVRKLTKLQKAAIPIPALIAPCKVEGIDPDWILKKKKSDNELNMKSNFISFHLLHNHHHHHHPNKIQ
jgi:hypothetical protein